MPQVYTETTNYKLKKPDEDNYFDIQDLNNALDAVDTVVKGLSDEIENIDESVAESIETQNQAINAQNQAITTQNQAIQEQNQTLETQNQKIEKMEDGTGIDENYNNEKSLKQRVEDAETSINKGQPIGIINMFAGSTAPLNWAICNGAELSRTEYSALFSVIGTLYGNGDGVNTFNVPDFCGIFPTGAGIQDKASFASEDYDGGTLGTYKQDSIQKHTHKTFLYEKGLSADGGTNSYVRDNHEEGVKGIESDRNPPDTDETDPITPAGDRSWEGYGRWGNITRPASLAVNFIIKVK